MQPTQSVVFRVLAGIRNNAKCNVKIVECCRQVCGGGALVQGGCGHLGAGAGAEQPQRCHSTPAAGPANSLDTCPPWCQYPSVPLIMPNSQGLGMLLYASAGCFWDVPVPSIQACQSLYGSLQDNRAHRHQLTLCGLAGERGAGGRHATGRGAAGARRAGHAAGGGRCRQQGGRCLHVHPGRHPARAGQVRMRSTNSFKR